MSLLLCASCLNPAVKTKKTKKREGFSLFGCPKQKNASGGGKKKIIKVLILGLKTKTKLNLCLCGFMKQFGDFFSKLSLKEEEEEDVSHL